MEIYMSAAYQVRPEAVALCRQAVIEFVDFIRANEPGTHLYAVLQQANDPTRFLNVFAFADETAREAHRTSEGVRRFTGVLYPETVGGVQFTEHHLVATNRSLAGGAESSPERG